MVYTGGALNELNGKMGISAPKNSVPVMKLIKVHKPKSKQELVSLIEFHYKNKCECGIKSQGTIEDFGKNLYNAQQTYWGDIRFSLKECTQWEYDLFIVQSLKGGLIEKKALTVLNQKLVTAKVIEAKGFLDEELRIDLLVQKNKTPFCGIQIKPATFLLMREEVISFNKKANEKWSKPVLYLYYNEDESFKNLDSVLKEIEALLSLD